MQVSRSRRRSSLALVAALLAALLVQAVGLPGAPPPAADAADGAPLLVDDPDAFELVRGGAPYAFLGIGGQDAWWTVLSSQAAAGARYGLAKDRYAAADPSLDSFYRELFSTAPYPSTAEFAEGHGGSAVVDAVTGYVPYFNDDRPSEVVAATVTEDGGIHVLGAQFRGFDHHVLAGTISGFSPQDLRGIAIVGQGDPRRNGQTGEIATLVVATRQLIYSYLLFVGLDGRVQVGPALTNDPPQDILAMAHRPAWDAEFGALPGGSPLDQFFLVVTEDPTSSFPATRSRARVELHRALGDGDTELERRLGTADAGPTTFDQGAEANGRNFQVMYDPYVVGEVGGVTRVGFFIGYRGPNRDAGGASNLFLADYRFPGNGATESFNWGNQGRDCPGQMDFRAYGDADDTGTPVHYAVCAEPWGGGGGVAAGEAVHMRRISGTSEAPGDNTVDAGQLMTFVGGGDRVNDPQVHLSFPCTELFRTGGIYRGTTFLGNQCPGATVDFDDGGTSDTTDDDTVTIQDPGSPMVTVLAGLDDQTGLLRRQTTRSILDHALFDYDGVSTVAVANAWGGRELPQVGGRAQYHLAQLPFDVQTTLVDLDPAYDGCVTGSPSTCRPPREQVDPVPLAILAAPPQVANANQTTFDPPLYATAQSTSGGTSSSTGGSVGVVGGVKLGDTVFNTAELEILAGYDFSFGAAEAETVEVTQSQAFTGLEDDDSVVYQSKDVYLYSGRVLRSSNGLTTGDEIAFEVPISVSRNVTSWDNLQALEPASFGPTGGAGGQPGVFHDAIEAVLSHDVGDPGSYPTYGAGGGALSSRCLGNVGGTQEDFDRLGRFAVTAANPFSPNVSPLPTPEDAIVVTEQFRTVAGSENGEGAEIEISRGTERSYNVEHSFSLSIQFEGGAGVKGIIGGSGAVTFGNETSFGLGQSTAFSASVGHFPNADLDEEVYDWRMYLCKQDLDAVGGFGIPFPVHVLGFTVDNYTGSGGLEDLAPIGLLDATGSERVSRTPTVRWDQPTGTVETYQVEVEAVGAADRFTWTPRTFASTLTGGTRDGAAGARPATTTSPLVPSSQPGRQLLADQLYRWRVTATDFFGNVEQSPYEFFVTDGPPTAAFTVSPPSPVVGEEVTFTADPVAGATYAWDLGGGATDTGPVVTTTYDTAGNVPVRLDVTTGEGTRSSSRVVAVAADRADDTYTATEDTVLRVAAPGVLDNDAGATSASLVSDATEGDLRLGADGRFTYTPDADVCGPDAFTYLGSGNGVAARAASAVTIDVACVNDVPRPGSGDDVAGVEGEPVVVAAPGLLADDVDPDGDPLSAVLVEDSADGTVTVSPDGAWTFEADDPEFCGTTSFRYAATDGTLTSPPQLVFLTIACVDDPPSAPTAPPVVEGREDTPTTGTTPIEDPDGDVLDFTVVEQPADGTVVVDPTTGTWTFTPDPDACGTQWFVIGVDDGTTVVPVRIRVDVACVDDPPPGPPDTTPGDGGDAPLVTAPGQPVVVDLADEDANPDDGESLVVTLVEVPATGTTRLVDGVLTYVPAPGDCGPVRIVYTVDDGTTTVEHVLEVDVTCVAGATAVRDVRVLGGAAALAEVIDAQVADATGRGVARLAGADRYATAAAVVRDSWSAGAETVYVVTGRNFPDSLTAGALAARDGAPVVLVDGADPAAVPTDLLAELAPAEVVVVGGEAAVTDEVVAALGRATGTVPSRVAGIDRFATAARLATDGWTDGAETVLLATGRDFPDALAGAAAAGELGMPILLTERDVVPAETLDALRSLDPARILVLGGAAAVSDEVVASLDDRLGIAPRRVAGRDRYETAAAIVAEAWPDGFPTAFVATGQTFPDALAGAAAAARRGSPVVLSAQSELPDVTRSTLVRLR